MKNLFLCYSRWSTCKKAKDWLDDNGIEFEYRDIKENNPNSKELKEWLDKSGLPLKKFFNTSGILYRELNVKEKLTTMSESELIDLLASDGMLVKRPLFIGENQVLIGFKEEQWEVLK